LWESAGMNYTVLESPVGDLTASADAEGRITGLHFPKDNTGPAPERDSSWVRNDQALAPLRSALKEYFAGERETFDLDLAPVGTPFQMQVWKALRDIPYGETRSYGDIAAAVGKPAGAKAVGQANGRNPIAIVVPCHRVVEADGSLGGYGGGGAAKTWLLDLEARTRARA
jgi:methylated-DNA-[protein]-cysteine S-methyltransferase